MGGIVSQIAETAVKGATPWGAIAMGIGALPNIISSISQGIRARKIGKQLNTLSANRPKYEIPKEYQDILAKYQQAQSGNMPGYEQQLDQVGQLGARTRGAAERGAISSNAYGAQVGDIYQKELDALQNLGMKQAEYKSSMLDKVAGAQGMLGAQKAEQWNQNENIPWQTRMNELTGQYQAMSGNAANARETATSSLMNFAGTKYYSDMLKKLYPQGTNTITENPYGNIIDTNNPVT
jgi:hypothetical protein